MDWTILTDNPAGTFGTLAMLFFVALAWGITGVVRAVLAWRASRRRQLRLGRGLS